MAGSGAAASANNIQPTLLRPFEELRREALGRFGKSCGREGIRQTGIRICADEERGDVRELFDVGPHFFRTKSAIEADGQKRKVGKGVEKGFYRLTSERSSAQVGDCARCHDRHARVLFKKSGDCKKRSLRVQRVENCFNKQNIHPACDEVFNLLGVGGSNLLEGHFTLSGIVDIPRNRQRAIERPDRPRNEDAPVCEGIRRLACDPRRRQVQFGNKMLEPVVGLRNCRRIECVRFNDIRPGGDVFAMNLTNDLRLREHKQVIVAF